MPVDAIIFVTEPPQFRVEDGLVHISQRVSEGLCIERVMRLNTFLKTLHLAKQALSSHEASETAKIIDFPRRANSH